MDPFLHLHKFQGWLIAAQIVGGKINAENERLFVITETETDSYVRAFLGVISRENAPEPSGWNLINFYANLCQQMQIKFQHQLSTVFT